MFTQYSLSAALALVLLLVTAKIWSRQSGRLPYALWMKLCILVIPLTLLGSRLLFSFYALMNGDFTSPGQMLYFRDGGASLTGAFFGVLAAAAIAERVWQAPKGSLMDALAIGAPLSVALLRLMDPTVDADTYLYSLGLGRMVDTEALSFLGEAFDGRHPVFIYQTVTALLIFVILLIVSRRSHSRRDGDLMLLFMTLYGATQMFFSSLNAGGNDHMVWYFIRFDQIAGLLMLLTAFVFWAVRVARRGHRKWTVILACVLFALGAAMGVVQEFAVDSNPDLLKEYGIMAVSIALMAEETLRMSHLANGGE